MLKLIKNLFGKKQDCVENGKSEENSTIIKAALAGLARYEDTKKNRLI